MLGRAHLFGNGPGRLRSPGGQRHREGQAGPARFLAHDRCPNLCVDCPLRISQPANRQLLGGTYYLPLIGLLLITYHLPIVSFWEVPSLILSLITCHSSRIITN